MPCQDSLARLAFVQVEDAKQRPRMRDTISERETPFFIVLSCNFPLSAALVFALSLTISVPGSACDFHVIEKHTFYKGLKAFILDSRVRLCLCIRRMEEFVTHCIKFVWTLKEKAWSCENAMTGKHRSGDLAPTPRKKELKQT